MRSISSVLFLAGLVAAPAIAQQRGQWLSGLAADNSGVMPEPGLTYSNIFYYDSSTRYKGPNGGPITVNGQYAVIADNNIFIYVTEKKFLGANLDFIADLVIANGSLAADVTRLGLPVNGGGAGFANAYFVPFQLSWNLKRLAIRTGYAFFAPTGRYTPGATNNIGTGFWTNATQTGAMLYLTKNKATTLNAFSITQFNTSQQGTNVTPGANESFDYSLLQILPLAKDEKWLLQVGPAGYGQWQVSNSSRPQFPGQIVANSRYGVAAVGFSANVISPVKKLSVGTSWFWEMGA